MYGMINSAIEDLVVTSAGVDVWNNIKQNAGIELSVFIDSAQYSDDITYKLVEAASETLGQSPEEILHAFGRHWTLYTGKEGWASVFDLGGDNMIDFINGLDSMHARVQIALPDAQMPEFSVVENADHLELTYRSPRPKLAPMVLGLLDGLAEQFEESWQVEHISEKSTKGCDIFHLRQIQANAA
ncbi:MAG: heme NO-binding domain-containing protein [Granulosicoccus sp.]